MLVTYAGLDAKSAIGSGQLRISGCYAVIEVIIQAGKRVFHVAVPVPDIVQLVGRIVPADKFGAGGKAVHGAERRGEIGLDGVVHGVGASVRLAVREVKTGDDGAAEGIQAIVDGRRAVELIAQGEAAAGGIGPKVLVICTGRYVVAVIGGDGGAVVAEGVLSGELDGGSGDTVVLHAKMHDTGRSGDEIQGVNLITGAQIPHHHGRLHGGFCVRGGGKTAVLDTFHIHLGLVIGAIHGIDIQVHGEFPFLQTAVQAAASAPRGSHAPDRAIEAVETLQL